MALTPDRVLIGNGNDALEVAIASASARPKVDDVRRLWAARWNRRAAPVALIVGYPANDVWKAAVCGTKDDPAVLIDLDLNQVERICTAALEAPDPANAERTLHRLLVGQKDQLVAGLTNVGLFASHELRTGVPQRADWDVARDKATTLLHRRGIELIRGLGYTATPHGSAALILSVNQTNRAVAVLLDEQELFDRPNPRFKRVTPVVQGLAIAQQQGLPWLLVTRGTQIRLYPANPDVGVGRKGQSETYTEIDIALLAQDEAAYLTLLFSADALTSGGTVAEILAASADHAAALGKRLRERVYDDVVPHLAMAVAKQMGAQSETELTEAYHRTLIILFRLLFVAYAEDRGLLPYQRNPRYTNRALKTLAREFTEKPDQEFDDVVTDRWDDLLAVWRAVDDGNKEWGVPAYNGGLFAADEAHQSGQAIAALRLTNAEIGPALRALLIDTGEDGTLGPVDFRSLSVREFGTIYEGLLESSLSIAPSNLTVDAKTGAYFPAKTTDNIEISAGQVYFHNKSGLRKSSGSYFTKAFAVDHLLDAALEPAITNHLAKVKYFLDTGDDAGAHEKFFDFRVADLAMGSGHFLVAAIDRIENRFAAFLTRHPISAVSEELRRLAERARNVLSSSAPDVEVEPSALLRRQIARRCIYGLDLNLIAVELARLGIWIDTFVPGLPMSSLDHNLVVGNSLTGIGTVDEVLRILEPQRVPGQYSLFAGEIETALSNARDRLNRVARTSEADKQEVREAHRAHAEAMEDAKDAKALLDAAIGVRLGVIPLPGGPHEAITTAKAKAVQDTIKELNAVHFPYLFPEVFLRAQGGFDVLIGNPPWEKVKVEEHQFWSSRFPGIQRGMPQHEAEAEIARLRRERPDLLAEYETLVESTAALRKILIAGYSGMGSGDPDLYKAFCWRNWALLRDGGAVGLVLPRSAVSASGTTQWRNVVFENGTFSKVTMLFNTGKWVFDDVDVRYSFALTALRKGMEHVGHVSLDGPYHSYDEYMRGKHRPALTFDSDKFRTWTTGSAFPALPSPESGAIFVQLRQHPRLDAAKAFTFRPVAEMHASGDRKSFDLNLDSPRGDMPVFKGSSFTIWDPDNGGYYGWAKTTIVLPLLQQKRLRQHRLARSAFSALPMKVVQDSTTLPCLRPRIAFRDVTKDTNSRSLVCALVPPNIILTHKAPYLLRIQGTIRDEAYLLGVLSSIPLDWYARRVVDVNMTFDVLNSFPIPTPVSGDPLHERIIEIAGRLASSDQRYSQWAAEVGVPVGSANDPVTRKDLIAELDAVVAHAYGLAGTALTHIFETFHRGWKYEDRLDAVLAHYNRWDQEVVA